MTLSERAKALRDQGLTYRQIAAELGITTSRAQRLITGLSFVLQRRDARRRKAQPFFIRLADDDPE